MKPYQIGTEELYDDDLRRAWFRITETTYDGWEEIQARFRHIAPPAPPTAEMLRHIDRARQHAEEVLGAAGLTRRATRLWRDEGEPDLDRALVGSDRCFRSVKIARTGRICLLVLDFTAMIGGETAMTAIVGTFAALADHMAAQGRAFQVHIVETEYNRTRKIAHINRVIVADGSRRFYSPSDLYPLLDMSHRFKMVNAADYADAGQYAAPAPDWIVRKYCPADKLVSRAEHVLGLMQEAHQ